MLEVVIPAQETFNDATQTFDYTKEVTLQLEHSLISISKWEARWHTPFLDGKPKTTEQRIDYIRCMTLNRHIDSKVYGFLTQENLQAIFNYIENPMTATTFKKLPHQRKTGEIQTSETIYYAMIACQIPFECQRWHLNRLLTLIEVCGRKNAPKKKMSSKEIMSQQVALNAARRKKLNSKG